VNWPYLAIGDACNVRRGTTITQTQSREGMVPVVAGGLNATYYHDKPNRPGNVITISASGANAGFVNFWASPIFASDCSTVEPNGVNVDIKFVYYFLRSKQDYINSKLRSGAAQPHVYAKDIAQLQLPLPPVAEQHRIAAILDQADALRAKRREALAQLDNLTQSIFIEMFGDPVTNPKGLPLMRGDQVCSRITVGIVVQPSSYYRDDGVPALRSLNIRPNKIVMENLVYFSVEDNATKLTKSQVRKGDVLLVRTGQPGTAAVVPAELDGVNAIDILIATPDVSKVMSEYMCFFFNSDAGKQMVLGAQRGQVQKHLNVGSMNSALIPVPSLDLQKAFANRIRSVGALKSVNSEVLSELDKLFASLQNRAFAGEL
jgi:type I restriction enzyme S subunit